MYDIAKIKANIDCVQYAQRNGLSIMRDGDRCVSPLRAGAKNRSSFVVRTDFWYDFGAAKGGDVIDLCAEMHHNGDKGAAIRELAAITNTPLEGVDDSERWTSYTRDLNSRAAYYHSKLTQEDRDYLHARGLFDEDIDRLMIGRVTDTELKGRLFLPYFQNGYCCYYATRAMPGGSYPERKYMKQKLDAYCQHVPWGLQTLDRGGDTLIIAEGYFDAVSFEAQGYPVLSAITGSFSRTQMPMVLSAARSFKRVLIVYDNDERSHAGDKFTERMAQLLLQHRIPFVVGHVPDRYKDISEYYAAGGSLDSIVVSAVDGMQYVCNAFTQLDELADFLKPLARGMKKIHLEMLFKSLREGGRFSADDIKILKQVVTSVPAEHDVASEVVTKYDLTYINNVGFYEWNGRVWVLVSDLTVQKYAGEVYGEQFTTANRVANACKLAKSIALNDSEFDRSPVLTFQNGTLELETGTFREFSKNDYCSIIMEYDYDADARCPNWLAFINDVTNDDGKREENLQFIPGYALMPDCKHQKIFVLLGKGGNGKSVYLDVIQRLFGARNVSTVEPASMPQDFQRITIKDSLLNIGADINSDFSRGEIREWLLKIADGQIIQACYKGKDYVKYKPRCKLVFACNAVPSAEIVNGLDRRLWFINFPCQYVEDPDPTDPMQRKRDVDIVPKLLSELPGIFNWVYDGYRLLRDVGYFTETNEHAEIVDQFRAVSNPVEEFCRDKDFGDQISRDDLYRDYRHWCEDAGHKPLSRTKFLPKFRDVMGKRIERETQVRVGGQAQRVFQFVTPPQRIEEQTTFWKG